MSPVKAFDLEPPVISIMTVFYQNFSKVNPTVHLRSKSSGELTLRILTCPSPFAAGRPKFSKSSLQLNEPYEMNIPLTFQNFTCPSQPAAGANIGWHDWGKPLLEMVSVKL